MVLGKMVISTYKNETGFISLSPYSKESILNVSKTLNVRPETLKLVRKKHGYNTRKYRHT